MTNNRDKHKKSKDRLIYKEKDFNNYKDKIGDGKKFSLIKTNLSKDRTIMHIINGWGLKKLPIPQGNSIFIQSCI